MTISVGVAPLGAGSSGHPTARADEWLRAADTAMYESKVKRSQPGDGRPSEPQGRDAVA